MAKLKGPLFSLGATQQLGKALVYFGWKGLDVVREYVVPANPNTIPQQTQRGYLRIAVGRVHLEQAETSHPWTIADSTAYALWASVVQSATTWFNQAVRHYVDRRVDGKQGLICRGGTFGAIGAASFNFKIYGYFIRALPACATGQFKWGVSKTALLNTAAATPNLPANEMIVNILGLASKTKYYIQFEGLTGPDYDGCKSGIYHVTTT